MSIPRYIIISPVRNETAYIEKTMQSIIQQKVLPVEWVIINDGSTDSTEDIIKKYLTQYSWIKLVNRADRGFTQVGKGVIETFYQGINAITDRNYDYVVKLDCDVSIESDYFENLLNRFEQNERLGIAGGTSHFEINNKWVEEKMPGFHPWAGARMYRRKCFEDIGGLVPTLGWDTIDLLRAQMKGWETIRYPDIKIKHLRMMSSRKGLWEGKVRLGRNFYITGYHPLFLIARSIYRLFEPPYFIETFGVLYGYLQALLKRERLIVSKEEKGFLRLQQLRRLIGAKI